MVNQALQSGKFIVIVIEVPALIKYVSWVSAYFLSDRLCPMHMNHKLPNDNWNLQYERAYIVYII